LPLASLPEYNSKRDLYCKNTNLDFVRIPGEKEVYYEMPGMFQGNG
jgi:hypothetical protein